ncbi:MAG: hypothetical protein WBD67_03820, partial [Terracidiphilus sp.]
FEPALAAYRQALRLDPNALFPVTGPSPIVQDITGQDTPRFHYALSRLFCSMGMLDDAVHQFRQAYEQHYSDIKQSLTDPEFAPLRARPEYRALMGLPPLAAHGNTVIIDFCINNATIGIGGAYATTERESGFDRRPAASCLEAGRIWPVASRGGAAGGVRAQFGDALGALLAALRRQSLGSTGVLGTPAEIGPAATPAPAAAAAPGTVGTGAQHEPMDHGPNRRDDPAGVRGALSPRSCRPPAALDAVEPSAA